MPIAVREIRTSSIKHDRQSHVLYPEENFGLAVSGT
jgi:hypothetical protein